MIEMMFAVALSGVRASTEAEPDAPTAPTQLNGEAPRQIAKPKPSREWHPNVSFEDEQECPIFFQKEVAGLGKVRVGPAYAEDGLPHAL